MEEAKGIQEIVSKSSSPKVEKMSSAVIKRIADINPFLNRNKVKDPREFFGRAEILDYVIEKLSYPEPQSVAVIGERRSGKSSLLTRLYQMLSKKEFERWCDLLSETERKHWEEIHANIDGYGKFVCILLDFAEITATSAKDFSWVIIDELVSEDEKLLKYVKRYPPMAEGESEENKREKHPQIILKNLLRDACKQGYRFVFLIDEFELLARNPGLEEGEYLSYLRGISDNYALAYVTSSRKSLSEISYDSDPHGSPFDNNFSQPRYLGLLEEGECEVLIKCIWKYYNDIFNYRNLWA